MASIVVKVKYEETLRRFNVDINEDRHLDLSMKGLRLKIISLFNLPSFIEFRLTYEDEDDDLVTLVDDDDLHDIVRQGLDPVRVAVHLNSVQSAQSLSAPSTRNAAPITPSPPNIHLNVAEVLKSPNSQQSTNPDAAKIMKSVQEPLTQALSNLSLDSSSKATSTSPVFAGLVGRLTKMGNVNGLNAVILNHGATCLSSNANVGNHPTTNPDGRKYEGARTDDIERVSAPLKGRNISVEYSSNKMCEYLSMINGDVSSLKKCSSNKESGDEYKTWAELMNNVSVKGKNVCCESSPYKMCGSAGMKKCKGVFYRKKYASSKEGDKAKTWAELVNSQQDASKKQSVRQAVARYGGFNPFPTQTPLGECPFTGIPLGFQRTSDPLLLEQIRSSNRCLNKADSLNSAVHKGITCDGCEVHPIVGPRFKSKVRYDYDLCSDCFYEIGNESDYDRIVLPSEYKHPHPFNAPDVANGLGPVLHKGVGCDDCRILPIVGPRFKSKVRYDYDLCTNCFAKMGNDTDYIKIDSPLTYKHPVLFKASDVKSPCPYMRSRKLKQPHYRLDSRFILDVNVMDGAAMAPSTPFTKIWRMRNNGTLPWKRDMQLLWIGGDRFRPSDSIRIQIPSSGVDVDCELDIAVDFIAPELPGKYVSFWRMAEQSGHKFGQRVWVQIQVDPSVDLTLETSPMLNLNLYPDSSETAFSKVVDVKVEPGSDIKVGESSSPSVLDQNVKTQMESLNFLINNDLLVGATDMSNLNAEKPRSVVAPSPNFYPDGVDDIGVSADAPSNVQDDSNILDRNDVLDNNNTFGKNNLQDDNTLGNDDVYDDNNTLNKDNVEDCDNTLDENINFEQIYACSEVEEKLEQIGFRQFDLNKEALETNEYVSDRSFNGLSDDSEWDPILEELKEMGFEDKDTNKKLLEKNNGSISRVVMDLIAEEKA